MSSAFKTLPPLPPQPPKLKSLSVENIAAANERTRRAAAIPLPANLNENPASMASGINTKGLSPKENGGEDDEMASLSLENGYQSLGSNNGGPSPKAKRVPAAPSPFQLLAERIASPFRSRASSEASEPGIPLVTPPRRAVVTPSIFNKLRNSIKSASRSSAFTPMEKQALKHFQNASLAKAYFPNREDIKDDIWYNRAMQTPNSFADMLILSSNIANFKVDGMPMFDAEDISKIRNYLVPDLIKASVKTRKASYLLEIARSPCFEEIITKDSAKFFRLKNGSTDASLPEDERQVYMDALPGYFANVALLLMSGVDIGNWDNLKWPIPAEIEEADKLKYIFDNHLIPAGVKPDEIAQQRFARCAPYLIGRSLAAEYDVPSSQGGKRRTRRYKRRGLRKSFRRTVK